MANKGIQKGQVATDALARKLDYQCKNQSKKLYERLSSLYPKLKYQSKLNQSQIPGGVGGCEPDGGLWFYDDLLIAVFEGKKQQNKGNAIERWFKNYYICKEINDDLSYVTFCTGEGVNGVIPKALNVAHPKGWNEYYGGKNSCYLSEEGFADDHIYNVMEEVILERISNLH